MKCLIVDDEALARERLSRMLASTEGWSVCGEAADGATALRQIEETQPDLVLLDIRMPGMDGLEVAGHLAGFDRPPAIVFTTAYGDHALEAFEAQAVDYLLKPIHPERLQVALGKARRLNSAQLQRLEDTTADGPRTHICARNRGNLEIIPVSEVVYFQADCKYVTVCSARRRILVEEPLKSLEHEFSNDFIRIHRNSLIAVNALCGVEKNAGGHHQVILKGVDERLEISRRMLPEVRRRLKSASNT
ncbi:MAG: LytTR family DNA-binding domain-containing protein [Thiogranum sp.]|nr:LytTR family DNA-binding domain-containing protein [Thiogranum sp.]